MDHPHLKKVAYAAVDTYVKSGMILGLGTGSTCYFVVQAVGERLKEGVLKDIRCVPTSKETELLARAQLIPLTTLAELQEQAIEKDYTNIDYIDLVIDGADAFHENSLNLIKGKGCALLREKIVQQHAKKFVVVCDISKRSNRNFGLNGVPVDISPSEWCSTVDRLKRNLKKLTYVTTIIRKEKILPAGNAPILTDDGNYVVEIYFEKPIDERKVAQCIESVVGTIEHGLFINMASIVLMIDDKGNVITYEK